MKLKLDYIDVKMNSKKINQPLQVVLLFKIPKSLKGFRPSLFGVRT